MSERTLEHCAALTVVRASAHVRMRCGMCSAVLAEGSFAVALQERTQESLVVEKHVCCGQEYSLPMLFGGHAAAKRASEEVFALIRGDSSSRLKLMSYESFFELVVAGRRQ